MKIIGYTTGGKLLTEVTVRELAVLMPAEFADYVGNRFSGVEETLVGREFHPDRSYTTPSEPVDKLRKVLETLVAALPLQPPRADTRDYAERKPERLGGEIAKHEFNPVARGSIPVGTAMGMVDVGAAERSLNPGATSNIDPKPRSTAHEHRIGKPEAP